MSDVGWKLLEGDCRARLQDLDAESVQTCITSPPYFGLRDYGHDAQIGHEPAPEEYVDALVAVFAEVHRVLRPDGTLWLNLGDAYNTRQRGSDNGWDKSRLNNPGRLQKAQRASLRPRPAVGGSKFKDLLGLPWMVAFALRAQGWWLRQEIIWEKRSPMPESVRDRCTRSHEQIFMFAKAARYYYDSAAIAEPAISDHPSGNDYRRPEQLSRGGRGQPHAWDDVGGTRNRRTVWTLSSEPFRDAHFATWPSKLVEPMVLGGSAPGDVVLDPFAGAGTTGLVALQHGRSFVGIELNPEYADLARRRCESATPPLFDGGASVPSEDAA